MTFVRNQFFQYFIQALLAQLSLERTIKDIIQQRTPQQVLVLHILDHFHCFMYICINVLHFVECASFDITRIRVKKRIELRSINVKTGNRAS